MRVWSTAAVVVISAAITGSLFADGEIEQGYAARWNVDPIARLSTGRQLVVNAARCRIDEGSMTGTWLPGRAVGTVLGKTTWRIELGGVPPGSYQVTYDLRTPTGAEWIPSTLRVPQIARNTGRTGTALAVPESWPQDRHKRIACDDGRVEFSWDHGGLYARSRDGRAVEITIDLLPVVAGRHVKRVKVSSATAIPWSELFPAVPLTGQVLRCRIEGDGSDWRDLLFVGSGERQFFGATIVSDGPGGDDQGPPASYLKAQMDMAGLDCHSASVAWENVEPVDPGQGPRRFDWSGLLTNVNLYKSGLVLVSINLQNHWAEPIKGADPRRYWILAEEFVSEAARKCAAVGVRHFTLGYNEPEMFFRTDKEDYFNTCLTHCADAVRKVVPDAVVLAGRFSSGNPKLIRTFYSHGFSGNFDVLDIHTYSNDPITGTAMGEIVASHQALQYLGMGGKRIFLGEGWGPTRKLPQVKREKWDAPVSTEEADVTRQYYQNGYRRLVTASPDYNPDWVLGAKYFTLNDNVGGTYWRQSAKPVYGPNGELLGRMIGELRFGPGNELKAFFCNGGLIDFSGKPKGQWFYDFPPALPEVRIVTHGGPDYVLPGEWHVLEVAVVNANPRPITDLRLGLRDRTGKFDGTISTEAVGGQARASLGQGDVWRSAIRVRVDKGRPGDVRLAIELSYDYDGEGHVSDDIVPTSLKEPVEVSASPSRVVLGGLTEKKITVRVRNNRRGRTTCRAVTSKGPDFSATPSVNKLALDSGQSAEYALTIRPSKLVPGVRNVDILEDVAASVAIVTPLSIGRISTAPEIDGRLSDWPRELVEQGSIRLGGRIGESQRRADDPFPKPQLVGESAIEAPLPSTPAFSADAALAWDDESLLLAIVVRDKSHDQRYMGADVWREDSVQIGLDPLLDADMSEGYRADDYELALALTPNGPEISVIAGPKDVPRGPLVGARIAVRPEQSFTTYEARIPWTALHGIVPKAAARFGFDILINNFEGSRRYTLGWAGGIAHGKYPGRFVPVVLR